MKEALPEKEDYLANPQYFKTDPSVFLEVKDTSVQRTKQHSRVPSYNIVEDNSKHYAKSEVQQRRLVAKMIS